MYYRVYPFRYYYYYYYTECHPSAAAEAAHTDFGQLENISNTWTPRGCTYVFFFFLNTNPTHDVL